jgi:hypothetical protein
MTKFHNFFSENSNFFANSKDIGVFRPNLTLILKGLLG